MVKIAYVLGGDSSNHELALAQERAAYIKSLIKRHDRDPSILAAKDICEERRWVGQDLDNFVTAQDNFLKAELQRIKESQAEPEIKQLQTKTVHLARRHVSLGVITLDSMTKNADAYLAEITAAGGRIIGKDNALQQVTKKWSGLKEQEINGLKEREQARKETLAERERSQAAAPAQEAFTTLPRFEGVSGPKGRRLPSKNQLTPENDNGIGSRVDPVIDLAAMAAANQQPIYYVGQDAQPPIPQLYTAEISDASLLLAIDSKFPPAPLDFLATTTYIAGTTLSPSYKLAGAVNEVQDALEKDDIAAKGGALQWKAAQLEVTDFAAASDIVPPSEGLQRAWIGSGIEELLLSTPFSWDNVNLTYEHQAGAPVNLETTAAAPTNGLLMGGTDVLAEAQVAAIRADYLFDLAGNFMQDPTVDLSNRDSITAGLDGYIQQLGPASDLKTSAMREVLLEIKQRHSANDEHPNDIIREMSDINDKYREALEPIVETAELLSSQREALAAAKEEVVNPEGSSIFDKSAQHEVRQAKKAVQETKNELAEQLAELHENFAAVIPALAPYTPDFVTFEHMPQLPIAELQSYIASFPQAEAAATLTTPIAAKVQDEVNEEKTPNFTPLDSSVIKSRPKGPAGRNRPQFKQKAYQEEEVAQQPTAVASELEARGQTARPTPAALKTLTTEQLKDLLREQVDIFFSIGNPADAYAEATSNRDALAALSKALKRATTLNDAKIIIADTLAVVDPKSSVAEVVRQIQYGSEHGKDQSKTLALLKTAISVACNDANQYVSQLSDLSADMTQLVGLKSKKELLEDRVERFTSKDSDWPWTKLYNATMMSILPSKKALAQTKTQLAELTDKINNTNVAFDCQTRSDFLAHIDAIPDHSRTLATLEKQLQHKELERNDLQLAISPAILPTMHSYKGLAERTLAGKAQAAFNFVGDLQTIAQDVTSKGTESKAKAATKVLNEISPFLEPVVALIDQRNAALATLNLAKQELTKATVELEQLKQQAKGGFFTGKPKNIAVIEANIAATTNKIAELTAESAAKQTTFDGISKSIPIALRELEPRLAELDEYVRTRTNQCTKALHLDAEIGRLTDKRTQLNATKDVVIASIATLDTLHKAVGDDVMTRVEALRGAAIGGELNLPQGLLDTINQGTTRMEAQTDSVRIAPKRSGLFGAIANAMDKLSSWAAGPYGASPHTENMPLAGKVIAIEDGTGRERYSLSLKAAQPDNEQTQAAKQELGSATAQALDGSRGQNEQAATESLLKGQDTPAKGRS